jgi:hypothetical protein
MPHALCTLPDARNPQSDVRRQIDIAASNHPALRAMPYALCPQFVIHNFISEDRKQGLEDRLQMREIRLHGLFIPATPWILLHFPLSDVLRYALCPLLCALFIRNPSMFASG